jgi:hypothetical protein
MTPEGTSTSIVIPISLWLSINVRAVRDIIYPNGKSQGYPYVIPLINIPQYH